MVPSTIITDSPSQRLKVLFFVEGLTDIRLLVGLSEICDLTVLVPATQYRESRLEERVIQSGIRVEVHKILGGRLLFQMRSLFWLWRNAPSFDLILSQELLRGSLNTTIIGKLRGVPVVTYMTFFPLEYFRCRRERRQIGILKSFIGENVIRFLMMTTGKLSTACLALGEYLQGVARQYCPNTLGCLYYGVDTAHFCPVTPEEKKSLRRKLDLPENKFLILFSSRISHEKDPETLLKGAELARKEGVDLVLLNLGGGFKSFLSLADKLSITDADQWILGRPAMHPMLELSDYYRASDVLVQSSLAEGCGLSPLEALACEIPVVATNVGGMSIHLKNFATLIPRQDVKAMKEALIWVSSQPNKAHEQALLGRAHVCQEWERGKAFSDLKDIFYRVAMK
jgi:glycosyltransferase involved in cell wall biosynthesis